MFRTPHRECEPAPVFFERLLRASLERNESLFGDDVGAELSDTLPPSLGIDARAVQCNDRARPVPLSELKNTLLSTLGLKRGVMAGLPEIAGLSSKPHERVLPMPERCVVGHAWWWLWWLKRTPFSRRDSYTYRTDEIVYRVGGDPEQSFDWFPGGASYNTKPGKLAALLNFGLAVYVRELAATPREPDFQAQVQQAAIQAFMQLEAATHSIAPAVFASMLVTNTDEYASREGMLLPATAAADGLSLAGDATRVVATVSVCQIHTFRLSDMLRAYITMGPEENRALAKQAIVQSVHEVCNHMDALSKLRIIKLTMTADSVVFCPELKEAGDDEWDVMGYTFRAAGFDPVAGKPRLIDYDHRLCRRLMGQDGYDAKCAYLLMMTVFLASIRAQFPAIYSMIYDAVQTFGHWKAAVEEAPDRVDAFRSLFQRTFINPRVERDPLPKRLLEDVVDDFATIVTNIGTGTGGNLCTYCDKRPAYHALMLWLLGTRSYTPSDTGSDDDVIAERDQHRRAMARVEKAVAARELRLRRRFK
tara:strand:- start:11650 stop:13248 length:1599 start_codon:yes stop_codon:yes gene_type:complete